jgi:hypothetical protein
MKGAGVALQPRDDAGLCDVPALRDRHELHDLWSNC